jgi:hypothetical protein
LQELGEELAHTGGSSTLPLGDLFAELAAGEELASGARKGLQHPVAEAFWWLVQQLVLEPPPFQGDVDPLDKLHHVARILKRRLGRLSVLFSALPKMCSQSRALTEERLGRFEVAAAQAFGEVTDQLPKVVAVSPPLRELTGLEPLRLKQEVLDENFWRRLFRAGTLGTQFGHAHTSSLRKSNA